MVTQALAAEPKGQPRTLLLLLVHLVEYLLVPRAELSTLLIAAAGRDNTVKYRWRTLQLLPGMERPSYAGTVVEVLEGLDGQLAVRYQDRERSSPARRRRPVLAYSEASTALPHTGRSLGSTSTVWAGAGRLSWRHSTSTIPSTTALSQFERPPPRQAGAHSASDGEVERCAEGEAQGPVDSKCRPRTGHPSGHGEEIHAG